MILSLTRHKFSLLDYQRMIETGILTSGDRVELIDGEVIEMSPIGKRHAGCVARLDKLWQQRLGEQVLVWVQNPIYLSNNSEPQPDLALLVPRDDFYIYELPTPQDILLLIEVADSTISYDREVKMPLYAAAGIAETWLINVSERSLEIYTQPANASYQQIHKCGGDTKFSPLAFPDVILQVKDVFGS